MSAYLLACKALNALCPHGLTIFTKNADKFALYVDVLTIDDIFLMRLRGYAFRFLGWCVSFALMISLWWLRIAVEVGILEFLCGITEIKNLQVPFALVLAKTCTTTYNLLELGHRAYLLVDNDKSAGFAIYAS